MASKSSSRFQASFDDIARSDDLNIRDDLGSVWSQMSSIGQSGQLQNLLVTDNGNRKGRKRFSLVCGYRRHRSMGFILQFYKLSGEYKRGLASGKQPSQVEEELKDTYSDDVGHYIEWLNDDHTNTAMIPFLGDYDESLLGLHSCAHDMLQSWLRKNKYFKEIRIRVVKGSRLELKRLQYEENAKRKDLSDLESAKVIHDLVQGYKKKHGVTLTKAKEMVGTELGGKTVSWVNQALSLLRLDDESKAALSSGVIQRSHALVLAREKDVKRRHKLLKKAESGCTVKTLESFYMSKKRPEKAPSNKRGKLIQGPRLRAVVHGHPVVVCEEGSDSGVFNVMIGSEVKLQFSITKAGHVRVRDSDNNPAFFSTPNGRLSIEPEGDSDFIAHIDDEALAVLSVTEKGLDFEPC